MEYMWSSGANRLGRNSRNEVRHIAEWRKQAFCSSAYGRNRVLFIGKGLAYRKTEETNISWTSYGQNWVMLIGRGVAYHKMEETDLLQSKRGSC